MAEIVIIVMGFDRADSIASLIVVWLMLHAAWGLLRETGRILLEAAPEGYAPGEIVTAISSQPGVASLHDVHVWLITSGFPALSAHVLVRPRPTATRCAASWSSSCASGSPWITPPCR